MRHTMLLASLVLLGACASEGKAPPPKRPDFSKPRTARQDADLGRTGSCCPVSSRSHAKCCGEPAPEDGALVDVAYVASGGTAFVGSGGLVVVKQGGVAFAGTGATVVVQAGGTVVGR